MEIEDSYSQHTGWLVFKKIADPTGSGAVYPAFSDETNVRVDVPLHSMPMDLPITSAGRWQTFVQQLMACCRLRSYDRCHVNGHLPAGD